jgi:putative transposase
MNLRPVSYKRHRFPPEITAHEVWLYFRFPLSLRLVEEMLLERGIVFLAIAAALVWRFVRTGGLAMLRMMNRPPGVGHSHHAH